MEGSAQAAQPLHDGRAWLGLCVGAQRSERGSVSTTLPAPPPPTGWVCPYRNPHTSPPKLCVPTYGPCVREREKGKQRLDRDMSNMI